MKIGHLQKKNKAEASHSFLVNYKDTSLLSRGVALAHMLFKGDYRSNYPLSQPMTKLYFLLKTRITVLKVNGSWFIIPYKMLDHVILEYEMKYL